jgi:hypothetical protein
MSCVGHQQRGHQIRWSAKAGLAQLGKSSRQIH